MERKIGHPGVYAFSVSQAGCKRFDLTEYRDMHWEGRSEEYLDQS